MSEDVKAKPTRRYDSSRRQEQARLTRAAVLDAARARFLDQGYAATTLALVASDAGVSVETIYKAFANKAGLLKSVFDVSVAGDDEPVPMAERDIIQRVIAEPHASKKLGLYIGHFTKTMQRVAPVQMLARDAAAADSDAAAVWRTIRGELLHAMTMFGQDLHRTGELKVTANTARDILWTYHSLEIYELLVLERKWSTKRYADFVLDALNAALLR